MSGSYTAPTLTVPVGPDDWSDGPEDAPVTFVEYGDFECPHCASMEPVLQELRRLAGPGMRFVYRHFPLTSSHPHAQSAAEAAEAAGAQGAFWPMHDALFANQQALTDRDLVGYAAALGLDADAVATALASHTYEPNVREDFMSGVRSGVSGTPTFFINGVRYDGEYTLDALARAVQKAGRAPR
ncbi:MAG: oxidoreductase [Thermomicrobiales bacterium]|nr:oxidoreductase [Thermomicrobiales bacterium]MDF3039513.1 oxidoreductase [Thermomicrobiales bacterium]